MSEGTGPSILLFSITHSLVAQYDTNGQLVSVHIGQGTDMGLYSSILGYKVADDRLQHFDKGIAEAGIHAEIKYLDYRATHPNNNKLSIAHVTENHLIEAISIGGGMNEPRVLNFVKLPLIDRLLNLVEVDVLNREFERGAVE